MRQHDQDYVPATEDALVCPGKHQDCIPRGREARCAGMRTHPPGRITVHTDFFKTQAWPRCVAAVTVNPGAPACARIHRDCTTETLDALACTGIHHLHPHHTGCPGMR